MTKRFGIITFLVSLCFASLAQDYNKSPVRQLNNYPGSVSTISWDGNKYFIPADSSFLNYPQCLVKNKKGLYAALNGSGRLYKATWKNDKLTFERIDSTTYFGSNFGSFIFSFRDTIYSLGGYGFWKTNGLLRYYLEQRHEWEIMKLNKEIPLKTGEIYDLIWYDQKNGKLYFGFTKEGPETTTAKDSKNDLHFETRVLDLNNKEWQQLGTLSPFLKTNLTSISNIASGPFGQMIAYGNENLFLDYANNEIYKLSNLKQREIEQLPTSTGSTHINYFIDSIFYSWLTEKGLGDSIKIGKNDLVSIDQKIYSPDQAPANMDAKKSSESVLPVILIILGIITATSVGYYFGKKRARSVSVPQTSEENMIENKKEFIIPFTALEIDVIQTVLENSSKGAYTSIEEINKILGVSKKNTDTQKKQRSDIISSINKKYSYVKQSRQELIEKRRTEFDKRSFEYFIATSNFKNVEAVIKPDIN